MNLKAKFLPKLNIATLQSIDTWHNIRIHTLLQNPGKKQPAINAYLGARYSRSADSIDYIANEIIKAGTDAAKRLETIFVGYGHKSVGDMAQLFVCLENIPMVVAARLFYFNSVVSGQERSTRYQNFQKPDFIQLPPEISKKENKNTTTYKQIFLKEMNDYNEMLEPTRKALKIYFKPNSNNKQELNALQARTFDTVRYFLPIGLKTSFALLMSARNWAENIARLRASKFKFENELAEILYILLSGGNNELKKLGYIPEADGLIRHTDANLENKNSTQKILDLLPKLTQKNFKLNTKEINVSLEHNTIKSMLLHYYLLKNPYVKYEDINLNKIDLDKLSKIIFKHHDHHHLLYNLGQTGNIVLDGYGDYGAVLKDINRHRSLERFFPIQEEELNFDEEFNRNIKNMYSLCNYLDIEEMNNLRKEYEKRFNETYNLILEWRENNKNYLEPNILDEYTRYLLPHAHLTRYRLYGSFDDIQYLIHLRVRNGGHIAYRNLVYNWATELNKKSRIFSGLINKLEPVAPKSREQFFDRS